MRDWELPAAAAAAAAADEDHDADLRGWEASSSDDEDLDKVGDAAGDAFVDFCLEQMYLGKMSATTLCTLCFWAARAGAEGKVKRCSLSPTSQSGKCSAHVDKTSGFNLKEDGDLFKLPVPIYAKFDASRSSVNLPMQLPHELFSSEVEAHPNLLDELEVKMKDSHWAGPYKEHVVVESSPDKPLPCCLYLDGVAVTNRDGVLGIWIYNEISERRHLCCVIRKSALCKCGCRGACTLHPVMNTIKWSLTALAAGTFPSVGPDGSPLSGWRAEVAGTSLGVRGALIHIKGDWMEFSSSLGLASWNAKIAPCPFCTVEKASLFVLSPFNPISSPWTVAKQDEYEEACSKAEHKVVMTRAQQREIVPLLQYTRKRDGGRGRCLAKGYEPLGLLKGDRLSPDENMHDVANFDTAFSDPAKINHTATFWRTSDETRTRWRNPLFAPEIGITTDILAIDLLHTLYLGVAKHFCMRVIWHLITSCIFTRPGLGPADRNQLGVLGVRASIWAFYKEEQRRDPNQTVHRLEDLTLSMIGTETKPKLNTKAAETKTLTCFCLSRLQEHRAAMDNAQTRALIKVGLSLCALIRNIDEPPRK